METARDNLSVGARSPAFPYEVEHLPFPLLSFASSSFQPGLTSHQGSPAREGHLPGLWEGVFFC